MALFLKSLLPPTDVKQKNNNNDCHIQESTFKMKRVGMWTMPDLREAGNGVIDIYGIYGEGGELRYIYVVFRHLATQLR